jgi:hypothetical protein
MGTKTYHGSCGCGKVRFEVRLDLAEGTFKCNCTMCTKTRLWGAAVKPDAFQLLSGEGELTKYSGGVEHFFCKHCGVKPFGRGEAPDLGGPFIAINLGALDDLDPKEWAQAPVQYMDGRNDNWAEEPAFTGHM